MSITASRLPARWMPKSPATNTSHAAALSPAREQALLAGAFVGLLLLVSLMAEVHLGSVARPLYMAASLGFAFVTMRRSPWLYLTATLWFWLFTAYARRIIEWKTGFNPSDVILAAPNMMMLFMLKDILFTKGLLGRRELGGALIFAGAIIYGLLVSFLRGDVVAGLVACGDWLGPLFYLFYINAHAEKIGTFPQHLRTFLIVNLVIQVPYSIYQYFVMPGWDAFWMVASDMGTLGEPLPMGSRVFGTTNNPGYLACWIGISLLVLPSLGSIVGMILLPFAIFLMFLTLVRSVLGGVVLGLVLMMVIGRGGQAFKSIMFAAVAVGTLSLGLLLIDPKVATAITGRLQTVQDLSDDDSAQTRALIWQHTPELMSLHPFGLGIGSQGRGAVASKTKDSIITIDSGPLAAYLALGWIGGTVYIGALLAIALQAIATSWRWKSSLMVAMTSAGVCMLSLFPFLNIVGFSAVLMWVFFGAVIAMAKSKLALAAVKSRTGLGAGWIPARIRA